MADNPFDYSGRSDYSSRTNDGTYINDPVRGNQGRDDPMFQAAKARRNGYQDDSFDQYNDIDLQLKNLQALENGAKKYYNDQYEMQEKLLTQKNKMSKQQENELKKQVKQSNQAYKDQLEFARKYYDANSKYMSDANKREYNARVKMQRDMAKSNMDYLKTTFTDSKKEYEKMQKDLEDLTASSSDKMKKSLLGSLDAFSQKLTGANFVTQLNRISSAVSNGGTVDSAQSSVANQYSLQRNAGMTDSDIKKMSGAVSDAVSQNKGTISRSDLFGAISTVANNTGIKNQKDLIDLGQSQLAGSKINSAASDSIQSFISTMYNTTKSESKATQSGTDMYNMMNYVVRGGNKNLRRTTSKNMQDIMSSVNDIAPDLASYANPKETTKISKNYASALVAAQSTMGSTDIMKAIAQSASGTWSDAQLKNIGITKGEAQSAMKSGNFTGLLEEVASATKQNGPSAADTLQAMGLNPKDVGTMKGYNSSEFQRDMNDVNSRKGYKQSAKDALSDNSINETNWFGRQGNKISNSFIGKGWESIQKATGLGGKDLLGKVTEINTWVRMIATKETFDSIKGIKNWFSGTKLGGKLKNIFKGSKDAAGLADDAVDATGKSGGFFSKSRNLLSKAKGLFSVPSDVAEAGGITGKVSRFLGIGSKATSGLGLLSMGLDGFGGITNSSKWLGSKKGNSISGSISSMLGGMIGGTGDGWTGKGSFLDKAFDTIGNIGKGAAAGGMAGSAFGGIGAIPGAIIGAITGGVTSIFGGKNIAKFFKGTWDKLKSGVSKTFDWIGNGISSAWDWVTGKDNKSSSSKKSKKNSKKTSSGTSYDYNDLSTDYINGKITYKEFQKALKDAGQSHKDGLTSVPYDGYIAELHKDEQVLTADQAKNYQANADPFNGAAATKAGQTQFNQMSTNSTSGGSAISVLTDLFKNANYTDESFTSKHVKAASSNSSDSDGDGQSTGKAYSGNVPASSVKGIQMLAPYAMKYATMYKTVPSMVLAQAGAESGFGKKVPNKWNWWGLTGNAAKEGVTTIDGYPYTIFKNLDQATQYYTSAITRMDPGKSHWSISSNMYGMKSFKEAAQMMANDTKYHEASPATYMKNLMSMYNTYDLGKYDKAAGYKVGTPWVPDDQIALIHKGEAVIPADKNPYNSNTQSATTTMMKIDDSGIIGAIQWAAYKIIENMGSNDDSWKSGPVTTKSRNTALRI